MRNEELLTEPEYPLHLASPGRLIRLERLGGDSNTQARLAALGFVPGVEMRVEKRSVNGPMMISLRNERLVLGQSLAQNLWVR